jgi:hypothetical protein
LEKERFGNPLFMCSIAARPAFKKCVFVCLLSESTWTQEGYYGHSYGHKLP